MSVKVKDLTKGDVYVADSVVYLYLGNVSYKKYTKNISGHTFIKLGREDDLPDVPIKDYVIEAVTNKELGLIKTFKGRPRIDSLLYKCLSVMDVDSILSEGKMVDVNGL